MENKEQIIAIIGGGSIGQRHIKNLKTLGYNNIYCLKRTLDKDFEKQFDVKVIITEDELRQIKPWTIFVCNPTSLHIDSLELCIEMGAHIFMEKPLTHSKEELQKAEALLSENDKMFFIGFMLRYHPLVKEIKNILEEKELGEVYSARFEFGSYLPYWHPWEDYKISYASRKELGGGVINTITHELDLIQYYFGAPKKVISYKANLDKLDIDVEELFEGILVYKNKLVTLHLDYLQKDYDRRISILCDQGRVQWNWHDNEVVVQKHKEETRKISLSDFDVNQLYIDELVGFFSLINDNKTEHDLNGHHAIENCLLTIALHESANKNNVI